MSKSNLYNGSGLYLSPSKLFQLCFQSEIGQIYIKTNENSDIAVYDTYGWLVPEAFIESRLVSVLFGDF